jgi:DNA-binding response OmpR family regulator
MASLPGRQTPPVLLVGRNIAAEDVRTGVQLGVRDVLAKPYSGAAVLERLIRMLKKGAPLPTSSPALAAQALGEARGRVYLNC